MTENYIELYKKYRPRTWDSIIGQDTIVKGLRSAVLTGKIPTAYLFVGGHGCGKTTSAFVLAKALNCENLTEDGNPCNECSSCIAIDSNTSPGVRYVSVANNGSADDMRKLTNDSQIAKPVKREVIILDEVHQLSKTGFDALLIPLENASSNVVYILCSTEPNKIPKTIGSRCQFRNFKPVSPKVLANNLAMISKKEGFKVDKETIINCVRNSKGSVRDSIRNLETVISSGSLPEEFSERVLSLITSHKYTELYKLTSEMAKNGQSFNDTAQQLYSDLTGVLILLSGEKPDMTYKTMEEIKTQVTPQEIIKYLSILGDSITNMSYNTIDSRILFEIAITQIINVRRNTKGGK